ncbi:PD-(D/E)XK nuclease family protein, partial [Candidatus Woesearchaeota archaeon]|nr:PD-(D/E)XK nuclease family protein [Candidatus Woesearchaeota archaeon]
LETQMASGLSFPEAFKKLTPQREKEYLSWDFYVKGFIDAVETADGNIRLMDYKTSKRAKLSDEYKLQLAIYALLYELEHKEKPHEVGIYFLKFKGVDAEQVLPVDEELIKHAKFKIEQIHMSTTTDNIADFPQNRSPLCKWSSGQCDFYDYCYNGKEIPPLLEPVVKNEKK